MKKTKTYHKKGPKKVVNDQKVDYSEKTIDVFKSLDEMTDFERQRAANRTHKECMELLNKLLKTVYADYLDENQNWKRSKGEITITEPKTKQWLT